MSADDLPEPQGEKPSHWVLSNSAAPATITTGRWVRGLLVGFGVYLLVTIVVAASIARASSGAASGLIGLVAGTLVAGRVAGARSWKQWALLGISMFGLLLVLAIAIFILAAPRTS